MVFGFIVGIFYLFFDIVYWIKWIATIVALRLREKVHRKRFDLYDFELENVPEKTGILVPEEEKIIESPLSEEKLESVADEVLFYGVNSKGEVMMVRILRDLNDMAEAWIYLKLADGRWFELEKTIGFQRNFGGKCTSFMCDGLQMFPLSAMRRWRISYCGMLRERKRSTETENKSIFVKFSFIWSASSDVFDATTDIDHKVAAKGIARAKWNSFIPPVNKVSKALNFYCQSGVLNGIVSIENESDKEIYLYGEKLRYIGNRHYLQGCKIRHIIGAIPESGLRFHFGKATIPNITDAMHFGFVLEPNCFLYPIEDGAVASNWTATDAQAKNFWAEFKTKRHKYRLIANYVDTIRFSTGDVWGKSHFQFREIEFDIDDCQGRGMMIVGEICNLRTIKIQKTPFLSHSGTPRTVYFTDEESYSTDLTGGKGSSLGKLTKFKKETKSDFTVPRGIVVTTVAYEELLTCEILEKIENLKNIVYGNVKGNVHEACKIVSTAIERSYLPDPITKEIEDKLSRLFDGKINKHRFAVRSSATGEDTDQMSAAGQMDTFLGVQGLKEIFTAVKKCWASQFGFIAVEYKRQNGQILNSPMAVVIQEMVECESAGVLFTCDPVTNNPSVTVITGNYGLGESVVSGSEEPDTVVLAKLPNGEMEIKDVVVGLKQHKIIMTDNKESDEGTVTEDVSEEEKNKCCISSEMALKLGKLSIKIEDYFKSPRDIEWGLKDGKIYILQSRPITTSTPVTDYEIKHEFDAALRCDIEFYSKSNVGEVMPNATSPLGIDVVVKCFSLSFQKKKMKRTQRNAFLQAKYFPNGILPFYNHMMMVVADLVTRAEDADHADSQGFMVAMFGRTLDDPDIHKLIKRKKYEPITKNLIFYYTFFKNLLFAGYGSESLKKEVFKYKIPAEKGRTSKEIFDLVVRSSSHTAEPMDQHMACLDASSLWNAYVMSILGSSKGTQQSEVYSDFAKLVATLSHVESADVPTAMQDLAEAIVKEIKGEDFRAMTVEKALDWLQTSNTSANSKYRLFMERHGHRGLKEFDMNCTTWVRDPKPLVKVLQSMTTVCENGKKKKHEDSANASPVISVPLSLTAKLLLKLALPFCRRGIRDREAAKSNLIKSFDNVRRGYRHLSKAMVSEGFLPDSGLLFFMTIDEIKDVLETRNPRIIARANYRRRLFPVLDALKFPEISKGRPVPINEQDEEIEYVADLTMKGIPVSQGTVKGYARVAMSLEEASDLKPGEILITFGTDIGWSPYFPILAGVVTELGGLISHGAVVSREYGLPCVVGLHGATRQFRTGDYVLLDGNKGILQRITAPEK